MTESGNLAPGSSTSNPDEPRAERESGRSPGPVAKSGVAAGENRPAYESGSRSSVLLRPDEKKSRIPEMQRALVILGALVLLGLTFYVGMKFPYLRYRLLTARNTPKLEGTLAAKFPNLSSDELVQQAIEAERAGKYNDAADRFIAAKYKNPTYRGILARVARIAYNQKDYATADRLFERSIAFGENVDVSNYFRGLIAVRQKNLPAALRFFEAAATANPFVGDYHYYLGETLRLDHRPREAIPHYEQAGRLVGNRGEEVVCRIKVRLARLEAGEGSKVREEIRAQQAAGKLPVEWLMTAAALNIREGAVDAAIPLILLARDGTEPGVFGSCVTDAFFVEAAQKNPRVKEVARVGD